MDDDHESLVAVGNGNDQPNQPLLESSKDGKKPGFFVYILSFFAAVGGFLFGYDTGVVSGALIILKEHFELNFFMEELVVSITIAGAILGALYAGPMSQYLGRKFVLIFSALIFTIGAVVMATAKNVSELLAGRTIVGLGIGSASMTVPVYIAEAAPAHLRGKLVTLNTLFITGGQFIASIVDGIFASDKENGWRYMLGLSGVPSVIMLIGLLFMPESPRWLVSKNKLEKARNVLRHIRNSDEISDEICDITKTIKREDDGQRCGIVFRIWNTPSVRKAIFVGCGLQAIQQLSGINTVMYYSSTIIKMAGTKSDEDAIWLAVPVAFTNFAFTIIGVFMVERMGRRKLLLTSLAGVIFSLLLLSITFLLDLQQSPSVMLHLKVNDSSCVTQYSHCFSCVEDISCGFCYQKIGSDYVNGSCLPVKSNYETGQAKNGLCNVTANDTLNWAYDHCPFALSWLAILGLVLYLACFAPGMGPMPWTVNSEIYPQWARSFGNSSSAATNWIFNLLVSITFLHLTRFLTKCGAFGLYTGISVLGWLFIYTFVPETKGKTLEEVNKLFETQDTNVRTCLNSSLASSNRMLDQETESSEE